MPAAIDITGNSLVIEITGADKLWALKSRLEVPIANVVGVAAAAAEAREWLHGMRLGGTHIPGVISAGRFYSHGQWVFWDVHDPDRGSVSSYGTSGTTSWWSRSTIRKVSSRGSARLSPPVASSVSVGLRGRGNRLIVVDPPSRRVRRRW